MCHGYGVDLKIAFQSFLVPGSEALKSAWSAQDTIFVFDTNVFLNLYGYEEQTRTDFFNTAIKLKEKIWIPHHVGLEYHRNRLKVIKREKKLFRDINSLLDKVKGAIPNELSKLGLTKKFPEINNHLLELAKKIDFHVDAVKAEVSPWDVKQADVRSTDSILESLDEVTRDRIGLPPENQKWLDDLYAEGKLRYAEKIPPGFEDLPKADGEKEEPVFTHGQLKYERAYGDLIIWKQLLSKAGSADVSSVFFVTDDAKKDWWSIIDSAGAKIIGPHESLKSEICRTSNVTFFHMYSTADFLKDGKQYLNTEILDSSISDAYEKNELINEEAQDADQDDSALDNADELRKKLLLIASMFESERLNETRLDQKSSHNDVSLDRKVGVNNKAFTAYYKKIQQSRRVNTTNSESDSERDLKQKDASRFDEHSSSSNVAAPQSDAVQYSAQRPIEASEPSQLDPSNVGIDNRPSEPPVL